MFIRGKTTRKSSAAASRDALSRSRRANASLASLDAIALDDIASSLAGFASFSQQKNITLGVDFCSTTPHPHAVGATASIFPTTFATTTSRNVSEASKRTIHSSLTSSPCARASPAHLRRAHAVHHHARPSHGRPYRGRANQNQSVQSSDASIARRSRERREISRS